jgi:cell division protein FtsA
MPESLYQCAIDLGSSQTAIIGCLVSHNEKKHQIQHMYSGPSRGIEKGYIINHHDAVAQLKQHVTSFEKISRKKIERARFSIAGIGLTSHYVKTRLERTSSGTEFKERDVQELLRKAEQLFSDKYPNKHILHVIPLHYKVDNTSIHGNPVGIIGQRLEVRVHIVTVPEHHVDALLKVVEEQGIEIEEIVASPLADAEACLQYEQKKQGVILINIGAETTTLSTFEHGNLTSVKVMSIGSSDITNDLSLGLQIDMKEAEHIKRGKKHNHPVKQVNNIIEARIEDIIEIAQEHLIKINKNFVMPAGVVWTGDGSQLSAIHDYTRSILKVPSQIHIMPKVGNKQRASEVQIKFSTAYGLAIMKSNYEISTSFSFKNLGKNIAYWFQQLKP